MVERFDFGRLTRNRSFTPEWFQNGIRLDEISRRSWEHQYQLAKQGREFRLPEERIPTTPNAQLHHALADEFWNDIPKDFQTILDVGCAEAYMLKIFKDAGKTAVGIDTLLYPTDHLYLEQHGLRAVEMDMHAMTFAAETFDAAWCRHTLEHSFAPLQLLAEIYRVLRPDGYLFVVVPPAGLYPGHWHQIPDYQLKYLLELCNFEVIKLETAWFSQFSPNDNVETRAIALKIGRLEPPLTLRSLLRRASSALARRAIRLVYGRPGVQSAPQG